MTEFKRRISLVTSHEGDPHRKKVGRSTRDIQPLIQPICMRLRKKQTGITDWGRLWSGSEIKENVLF